VRECEHARFVPEEFDIYGKPTPLILSVPFGAPLRPVRPSMQAKAALKQLVRRRESQGCKGAAAAEGLVRDFLGRSP